MENGIVKCGDFMNIPLQKLLAKMDTELHGAKQAQSDVALRERIYSLKTLCELVLDEPAQEKIHAVRAETTVQTAVQVPRQAQPSLSSDTKRLEMEDANGESLWDF